MFNWICWSDIWKYYYILVFLFVESSTIRVVFLKSIQILFSPNCLAWPGWGPPAAGDPVLGDACDHLRAPDLHAAWEVLRGLDLLRLCSLWLIVSVQSKPHLTLVIRTWCPWVGIIKCFLNLFIISFLLLLHNCHKTDDPFVDPLGGYYYI